MPIEHHEKNLSPSPSLAPIPDNGAPRLIDNGLLHYEASLAGFAERYGRGETSHTIHIWWARRPHTAMRALVFACLCKKNTKNAEKLLSRIGLATSLSDKAIEAAREYIAEQYNEAPKVLDMFGGGGTIPFEALNLGAETYAIDANELSVFIQKCNLFYSQGLEGNKTQILLTASGTRVLNSLQKETAPLFPLRQAGNDLGGERPAFGYLWSYSFTCPECQYQYFVSKRPWLSKKKGQRLAIVIHGEENRQTVSIETVAKDYPYPSSWTGRNGHTKCPRCDHKSPKMNIKECEDELVALIRPARGSGKEFIPVIANAVPAAHLIKKIETDALAYLNTGLPSSALPVWSGIVNPALYGVDTHADFLNQRQRAVLVLLIKCLYDEYRYLLETENQETAKYIISLLSSLIDQVVDWNCRLSMWIPQNEQVGRGFCGPGISMLWDYVETDPVSSGPSNLWDKLKRIVKGSLSIKPFPKRSHIQHAYAQDLPFKDDFFDAIVTDPPYYDNVYYSALADFFFAWKRILLSRIEPELFGNESTDFKRELVASRYRNGTADKAHATYCHELKLAIMEAARVIKPDGVFSFIYSHSSLNGWEALIKAYRSSKLTITSIQPLSIERKQRPRAMTSQAVNTCISFIARKYLQDKKPESMETIENRFREICEGHFVTDLEKSGWNESDTAIAAYAHAVALLANVTAIKNCANDAEALIRLEGILKERIPSFKVTKRKSL